MVETVSRPGRAVLAARWTASDLHDQSDRFETFDLSRRLCRQETASASTQSELDLWRQTPDESTAVSTLQHAINFIDSDGWHPGALQFLGDIFHMHSQTTYPRSWPKRVTSCRVGTSLYENTSFKKRKLRLQLANKSQTRLTRTMLGI